MKEGLEEFLRRIEEKPTNETLIDRFVSLVLEEEILDRVLYLKKLVGLLLNLNPYIALKIAALELQEARKERLTKEYEIGALKDVESCFLKLDKSDNAQLVRDEISKLMLENSRLHLKPTPIAEVVEPENPADRKAKLHFRLPQGEREEQTTPQGLPVPRQQEAISGGSESSPEDREEARRSALQISAVGVGPNILAAHKESERAVLRNAASLFDAVQEFPPVTDDSSLEQATVLLNEPIPPVNMSGQIYDESQHLHFPEQTQNLSMTNRYKTALAKPLEALAKPHVQAPPIPAREDRAFANPYGDDDTAVRETRPLFPQVDNDPTEILAQPYVKEFVKDLPPSIPAPATPSATEDKVPSQGGMTELRRWQVFQERLLLASGLQIERKIAQEYLQKLCGGDSQSDAFRILMSVVLEAQKAHFSQHLQQHLLVWMFEDLEPKALHQFWSSLRMQDEAPYFLESYVRKLLLQEEYRRAFFVLRDLAVPNMSLAWARMTFSLLQLVWERLHIRGWYWGEDEGTESLAERLRRREEQSPAAAV